MTLALGVAVANMSIAMIEPLLPLYLAREYGYTDKTIGLFVGIQAIGYLVSTPLAGFLSDNVTLF